MCCKVPLRPPSHLPAPSPFPAPRPLALPTLGHLPHSQEGLSSPCLPTGSLSGPHFLKVFTAPRFYPSFTFFQVLGQPQDSFCPPTPPHLLLGMSPLMSLLLNPHTRLALLPLEPRRHGTHSCLALGSVPLATLPSRLPVLRVRPSLSSLSGLHPSRTLFPSPHSGFSKAPMESESLEAPEAPRLGLGCTPDGGLQGGPEPQVPLPRAQPSRKPGSSVL